MTGRPNERAGGDSGLPSRFHVERSWAAAPQHGRCGSEHFMKSIGVRFGIIGWFGCALVLYVLGVGPAVRFSLGSHWGNLVDVIWQPIIALDGTDARPLYRGYLGLWGVHFAGPIGF